MKRTLSINLNNSIFNIDEDAYNELQSYLTSLKNHFSKEEGGEEILSDIESRIAEIFKDKTTDFKQVITIEDINAIIETLGRPETIIDNDDTQEEFQSKKTKMRKNKIRRIYRDTDNRIIGGVSSGLAAYFNIDPVFVRVIMALTFLFSGPLVYILLWIAIPAATTTAQKLEMKGEKVNVSNIEKSIREELTEVKENFKNFRTSKVYEGSQNVFIQIIHAVFTIVKYIFKFIIGIVGFTFIITGLILLFVFSGSFIFEGWGMINVSFPNLLNVFAEQSSVTIGSIGFFLLIGIPVLAIIYGGIKMLFNIKSKNKTIGLTLFLFWFLGVILFATALIFESTNFSNKESKITKHKLSEITSDTLFIDINKKHIFNEDEYIVSSNEFNLINSDEQLMIMASPKLIIQESKNDYFELIVKKCSHGKNKNIAFNNALNIEYNWALKDSLIIFDNYFIIKETSKWRNQDVKLILKVPAGKTIYTNNDVNSILSYYHFDDEIYINDFLDEFYFF